ncbi:MAG: class I SAM-dependent methyltransferase [Actinomycetota bacterium]|nr:class I SAM-dependent methyltransferase [Actinomycetota bacterium]
MNVADHWPSAELETDLSCPCCGARASILLYEGLSDRVFGTAPGVWTLRGCRDCGSAYLDPRPDEASIGRAYETYYTHEGDASTWPSGARRQLLHAYLNDRWGYALESALPFGRVIEMLVPQRTAVTAREIRHLPSRPGGRLLDVGAGSGAFVAFARHLGWDAEGLDPDPSAAESAQARGVAVRHGTLADVAEGGCPFAAVTLSHVIEHLHDPLRELQRIRRLLAPDGRLWIATPNLDALGHRRYGRDWLGLDPPRHLILFTPASLRRLLGRAGFEVAHVPRAAPNAWQTFDQSRAIRAGRRPSFAGDIAKKFDLAKLADLIAFASPGLAEELVIVAHPIAAAG